MLRPLRPIDDGLIYHVINRGNNRQDVFRALSEQLTVPGPEPSTYALGGLALLGFGLATPSCITL